MQGKTVGVDATTLEANAAMRSIERRDTGESYEAFVRQLAKASGIETPTRAELARFDRSRKDRKTSNKAWQSPSQVPRRLPPVGFDKRYCVNEGRSRFRWCGVSAGRVSLSAPPSGPSHPSAVRAASRGRPHELEALRIVAVKHDLVIAALSAIWAWRRSISLCRSAIACAMTLMVLESSGPAMGMSTNGVRPWRGRRCGSPGRGLRGRARPGHG